MKRLIVAALVGGLVLIVALIAFVSGPPSEQSRVPTLWPYLNGDLENTRNALDEKMITAATVSELEPFWSVPLAGGVKLATPIVDEDALYIPTGASRLYRINRATGAVDWEISIPEAVSVPGATTRSSVAVADGKIVFGLRNKPVVVALDAGSGELLWKTTIDEHRFAQVAQSPIVADGRVFLSLTGVAEEAMPALTPNYKCCDFRGSTVALDLSDGTLLWKTYVLPEGFAGASIWSGAGAYDAKRRALYITTGNAYLAPADVQQCVTDNKDDEAAQAACHPPGVWYDSIIAFDADTGAIKWGHRGSHDDFFTAGCLQFDGAPVRACGEGPDHDFGTAPMVWSAGGREFVGAGQKSGVFWALDPDSGEVNWRGHSGSSGPLGGMEFGTATDGERIYFADSNAKFPSYTPQPNTMPDGMVIKYGSVGAFDAATGERLWQVPDPAGAQLSATSESCDSLAGTGANCSGPFIKAPVTVAAGVVYTCSIESEGHMYAFDAHDGSLLWRYKSGSSCETGPAILDGVIYWASGQTLRAFAVPGTDAESYLVRSGPAAPAAISGKTVLAGVYTQQQAERGRSVYLKSCADGCHLKNLVGNGPAVGLVGTAFLSRWRGLSLADLFARIRDTMPVDNPAGLSPNDYLAVTSYLLAANGFLPGTEALEASDALSEISITEISK
jgi:polyvinyl alcohol dehydrogenase (cytochrome)